jgi:Ni/Co efflux regulator RcnB
MKRMLTATAAALIGLASLSGAAMAQPGHYDHGHDQHGPQGRDDHGHHSWRKGERIDHNEWRRYSAVDWRRHHLRQPPRGYEWREVNGQYVMAAAATGLVAAIIAASN